MVDVVQGIKIFYTDGSVEAIRPMNTVNWRSLSSRHVQVIMEYMVESTQSGTPYRRVLDGGDWYWWDDRAKKVMQDRSDGGVTNSKPSGVPQLDLKQGEGVTDEEFRIRLDQAMNDQVRP